jgi:hypothetical protein
LTSKPVILIVRGTPPNVPIVAKRLSGPAVPERVPPANMPARGVVSGFVTLGVRPTKKQVAPEQWRFPVRLPMAGYTLTRPPVVRVPGADALAERAIAPVRTSPNRVALTL